MSQHLETSQLRARKCMDDINYLYYVIHAFKSLFMNYIIYSVFDLISDYFHSDQLARNSWLDVFWKIDPSFSHVKKRGQKKYPELENRPIAFPCEKKNCYQNRHSKLRIDEFYQLTEENALIS